MLSVSFATRQETRLRVVARENWRFAPFLLWVALSVSWSRAPGAGWTALHLCEATLFALLLGTQTSPARQRNVWLTAFVIVLLFSAYQEWTFPLSNNERPELWSFAHPKGTHFIVGVFDQKNIFGRVLALGVMVASFSYVGARAIVVRLIAVLMFVVCALFLWWCKSATSILGASALFAVVLWASGGRRLVARHGRAVIFGIAAVLVAIVAFILLQRDWTLTGRVPFWHVLGAAISRFDAKQILLGSGLGGFWRLDHDQAIAIWKHIGYVSLQAHGGFIDLFLDLGLVGLLLYLAALTKLLRRTWTHISAMQGPDRDSAWPLCAALYVLGFNLIDSSLLQTTEWVLLLSSAGWSIARDSTLSATPVA
jgi:hypothetical protein